MTTETPQPEVVTAAGSRRDELALAGLIITPGNDETAVNRVRRQLHAVAYCLSSQTGEAFAAVVSDALQGACGRGRQESERRVTIECSEGHGETP